MDPLDPPLIRCQSIGIIASILSSAVKVKVCVFVCHCLVSTSVQQCIHPSGSLKFHVCVYDHAGLQVGRNSILCLRVLGCVCDGGLLRC